MTRGELGLRLRDRVDRAFARFDRLFVLVAKRLELEVVIGVEPGDILTSEILEGAPVAATLFDQRDDRRGDLDLDQLLLVIDRPDERRLAGPVGLTEVDVIVQRDAGRVGLERAELLLEPAFGQREVGGRQRDVHQLGCAILDIFERRRGPVLVDGGVALEREAAVQVAAAARIVDEQRVHPAFDRHAAVMVGERIGDSLLALAGRVDVEHGGWSLWLSISTTCLRKCPCIEAQLCTT